MGKNQNVLPSKIQDGKQQSRIVRFVVQLRIPYRADVKTGTGITDLPSAGANSNFLIETYLGVTKFDVLVK